jgi:hypothetical protein
VSAALKWAWGDELPKEPARQGPAGLAGASAWASILRYGEHGTIVDRQPNRYGCVPFDDAAFPHEDAIRIYEAVVDLGGMAIEVPEGWHPMPDLALIDEALAAKAASDALARATVTQEGGEVYFRMRPDALLVRHAIIGTVPDWRFDEAPEKRFECWPNGRQRWFLKQQTRMVIGEHADGSQKIEVASVEVDGWSAKRQRPLAGAYRKAMLDPDPVPAMVARAEYQIFGQAMAALFEALCGRLETIDLQAPNWPETPWDDSAEWGETARPGKVLPDLRAMAERIVEARRQAKSKAKAKRKGPRKSP